MRFAASRIRSWPQRTKGFYTDVRMEMKKVTTPSFKEVRATTNLARLWQSQDKSQEAYDLLAPVYGWFTEGFDTADLQGARALLDGLGE